MKKHILSIALVLIFTLTIVPLAVAAEISPHPHTSAPKFPHDDAVKNFSISSIPAKDYYYQPPTEDVKTWFFTNNQTYLLYAEASEALVWVFTDGWVYAKLYDEGTTNISGIMKVYLGNMDAFSAENSIAILEGLGDLDKLGDMDILAILDSPDGSTIEVYPDGCTRVTLADGISILVAEDGTLVTEDANSNETPSLPQPAPMPTAPIAATPNNSTVYVDGNAVAFDAYTINQENYIKLRDVALTFDGSRVQFDLAYDGTANMISITSGKAYTPDGTEMKAKGTEIKTASLNKSKIMLDGKEIELTAYTIDGNNYFKLRELAITFDFAVGWDGASNSITVDTANTYTP